MQGKLCTFLAKCCISKYKFKIFWWIYNSSWLWILCLPILPLKTAKYLRKNCTFHLWSRAFCQIVGEQRVLFVCCRVTVLAAKKDVRKPPNILQKQNMVWTFSIFCPLSVLQFLIMISRHMHHFSCLMKRYVIMYGVGLMASSFCSGRCWSPLPKQCLILRCTGATGSMCICGFDLNLVLISQVKIFCGVIKHLDRDYSSLNCFCIATIWKLWRKLCWEDLGCGTGVICI